MSDDETPPVVCRIDELDGQDREERAEQAETEMASRYIGADEREDGYAFRFTGTDGTLEALARFVRDEHECCAFASYRIEIEPPYEETLLVITGPEGTKDLFADLVDRLEAAGS